MSTYSFYAAQGWQVGAAMQKMFYVCRDTHRGSQILDTAILSGPYETLAEATNVAKAEQKRN